MINIRDKIIMIILLILLRMLYVLLLTFIFVTFTLTFLNFIFWHLFFCVVYRYTVYYIQCIFVGLHAIYNSE